MGMRIGQLALGVVIFLLCARPAAAMRIDAGVQFRAGGSIGINTVNNTIASVTEMRLNGTYADFIGLAAESRFVWDVDRHQMLCPEVPDCSVNATAVDRNLLFGYPFLRSWAANGTYINFNESVGIVVNAGGVFPVIMEVSKPSETANYTMSWNGTHHTYDLTKSELGGTPFNATVVNVSRIYYGGESNATDISFGYGRTERLVATDEPDPITNAPDQTFYVRTNYRSAEGAELSGACSVQVFGAAYGMAWKPSAAAYEAGISAVNRSEDTHVYNVSCANSSYEPQAALGTIEIRSGGGSPIGGGVGGGGGGGAPTTTTTTTTLPEPVTRPDIVEWADSLIMGVMAVSADDMMGWAGTGALAAAADAVAFLRLDNALTRRLLATVTLPGRLALPVPVGLMVFAAAFYFTFAGVRRGLRRRKGRHADGRLAPALVALLVAAIAVMVVVPA